MNLGDTAEAIATAFGTLSISSPSETATATHLLPNQVGKLALLVYPPTGLLGRTVSSRRDDTLDFPVRLLRDPLDMPGRSSALYAWYDQLRDRVERNFDLGLSYVAWAQAVEARVEIEGEPYAAASGGRADFDVVELVIRVRFDEVVNTDAI